MGLDDLYPLGRGGKERGVASNSRKVRSELKRLPVRTGPEDPFGVSDKYLPVLSTELEPGWWLIEAYSTIAGAGLDASRAWDGIPFDIRARWTAAGGGGNSLIATVPSSERFFIYASNLIVEARSRSFIAEADVQINVTPVSGYDRSTLYFDSAWPNSGDLVQVPRWAKRFRIELDDPTMYGTGYFNMHAGAGSSEPMIMGPLIKHYLTDQPDDGWIVGDCRLLDVQVGCGFRAIFELEI